MGPINTTNARDTPKDRLATNSTPVYVGRMPTLDLLTTAEVAELLGRDVRSIHRAATRGDLPYAHKGKGLRGAFTFDARIIRELASKGTTDA